MTDGGTSVVSLNEYTGVVRRWFRVVVAVVVLGAMAGTVLVLVQPTVYVAEALVQVRPIVSQSDDPNLDTRRQINPATEVAIANSQRVAELALARRWAADQLAITDVAAPEVVERAATVEVGLEETLAAMGDLSVQALDDTDILVFRARASQPAKAQALAQSSALAYLEFRHEEAIAGNADSRGRLVAREEQLVAELDDLAALIGAAGDEAQVQALAYADISKRQELTVIGTKFANLESLTIDPGVVLTDAALPAGAEKLPLAAGSITGAALGLVAALTAAFLLDRNDDRLRSGGAELSALGVAMLGTAPVRPPNPRLAGRDQAPASQLYPVNTSGGDAYRRLHGTLAFNLDTDNKRVVLVAGVTEDSAATSVAVNIGATAARAGRRTLVIGGDLRNAKLGLHLGQPADVPGLSDVILSGDRLGQSIHRVDDIDNLLVLAAGTRIDRPTDVFQSEAFARLMAAVEADFELVVVEAPPILRVADAVDAAGFCDGAIIVAEQGSDSRKAIADSIAQLHNVGSHIIGVVVADASADARAGVGAGLG